MTPEPHAETATTHPLDQHRDPAQVAKVRRLAVEVAARYGGDLTRMRRANGYSNATWVGDGIAVRIAHTPVDMTREVALACDFRIAADDAVLGQPEVSLGIIPGAGGTQRLARLVGPSRAKDLVFSGRFVKAPEALAIGLVDSVVPASEVYESARSMMARYVGGPAYALRAAKEAIDRGLEVDLDSGLEIERMLFSALFATKDRAIGMRHFVDKGRGPAPFEGA